MALSQQHLADEQSTLLLAGAKVSGAIRGLKLRLDAVCRTHTHTHTHIPYSLSNADSLSSNSTFFCFSHSHYTKIIPLVSGSIIGTKPSIPCKSTILLFICPHSLILCSGHCYCHRQSAHNQMAYGI